MPRKTYTDADYVLARHGINVLDPTAAQDTATKNYVDQQVAGARQYTDQQTATTRQYAIYAQSAPQTLTQASTTYLTFGNAIKTAANVTTSDNSTFTFGLNGLWAATACLITDGSATSSGRHQLTMSFGTGILGGFVGNSAWQPQSGGGLCDLVTSELYVTDYTKATVRAAVYLYAPPATVTGGGNTNTSVSTSIRFTYWGPCN